MDHIINGDTHFDSKSGTTQLRSGLHTFEGATRFLEKNPHIKPIEQRDFSNPELWYHTQIQSNGVIHLRLPEISFTQKALKSSLQSDLQMQNGHQWKTLFPKGLSKIDIYKGIKAVLDRPRKIMSAGWQTKIEGAMKGPMGEITIRVVINTRTGEIITAFPKIIQSNLVEKLPNGFSRNAVEYQSLPPKFFFHSLRSVRDNPLTAMARSLRKIASNKKWFSTDYPSKQKILEVLLRPVEGKSEQLFTNTRLDLMHSLGTYTDIKPGEYIATGMKVFDQYLKDFEFGQRQKFNYSRELINRAVIGEATLFYDFVWTRTLLQTIINNKNSYRSEDYQDLLRLFIDSPVFWGAFIYQPKSNSRPSTAAINSVMSFYSYKNLSIDHTLIKHDTFYQIQVEGVQHLYKELIKRHIRDQDIFDEFLKLPEYQPGGDKHRLGIQMVIDFVNSRLLVPYFIRFTDSPINHAFKDFEAEKVKFLYQWKSVRPQIEWALKQLEEWRLDLDINNLLANHYDEIINRRYPFIEGTHHLARLQIRPGNHDPIKIYNRRYVFSIGDPSFQHYVTRYKYNRFTSKLLNFLFPEP